MHFTVLKINFLVIVFLISSQIFGQAPISRLYGTYATETGTAGLILQDSTIYALGTSSAFTSMSSQIYLIKTDKNGDLLWSKFYGGTGVDDAVDMFVDLTVDTSIYILSTSFINFNKGYDVKIFKVDKNGNLIWEKNYGTTNWDIPTKMIKTSTDLFAICGKTYGGSFGAIDGMFLLLDNNCDSLYFNSYGDLEDNIFNDLIERSSDTLVFCGESYTASGMKRAWLLEMNIETGSSKNSFFGTTYNHTYNSIESYSNGNYLIAHTTDSTFVTQTNIFALVMHKNSHSILLTMPVIESADEIATEVKFFNNLFHMVGITKSYGFGGWEAVIYLFDSLGSYVYGKTYGTAGDEYTAYVMPNMSLGFAIVGTSGGVFGIQDLWIINIDSSHANIAIIDSQLDINAIHENQSSSVEFTVYPNPFSNYINIESKYDVEQVFIKDNLGRIVSSFNNTKNIDLNLLPAGNYFISVKFIDGTFGSKCLVKFE